MNKSNKDLKGLTVNYYYLQVSQYDTLYAYVVFSSTFEKEKAKIEFSIF